MSEITITVCGCTVVATDGRRTSARTCSSPSVAKGLATRFRNYPELCDKWLGPHPKPIKLAPVALPPSRPAVMVSRKGKIVTAVTDGVLGRSYECRNVQCAVALETKLTSDRAFAAQWVQDGDPESPEVPRHGLERQMVEF
jgi:hypothetical protein